MPRTSKPETPSTGARANTGFLALLGFLAGLVVGVAVFAMGLNSVDEGDNPVLVACMVVALLAPAVGLLLAVRLGRRR